MDDPCIVTYTLTAGCIVYQILPPSMTSKLKYDKDRFDIRNYSSWFH